jgi:hypothetical protein
MGFKRVFFSGIVGMLFLIPMAWIAFVFLDLGSAVTGGVITNLGVAIAMLITGIAPTGGEGDFLAILLSVLANGLIGVVLLIIFPLDWVLIYRPDEPLMMLAIVLPWILCCTIASALFAHSPKGGFTTSIAIGLGYLIPSIIVYIIILSLAGTAGGGGPGGMDLSFIPDIFDSAFTGLTDRPFLLSVLTATMEGALIGSVFGAFIGSLKYKPEGAKAKPTTIEEPSFGVEEKKEKKKEKEKAKKKEAAPEEKAGFCIHCGAKLTPDDSFCTNCGAKV